ncbi:hypothetical protein CEXT_717631 [Caerostris extrusa]|uniref:Uncharacterized protein n=1 Tax=Caerostris extrusa TaxID=172846 RepID=A0AAV4NNB3_CAEEX|nr:hypothetical protein CEXT_717631 [Caerostris extrusa]
MGKGPKASGRYFRSALRDLTGVGSFDGFRVAAALERGEPLDGHDAFSPPVREKIAPREERGKSRECGRIDLNFPVSIPDIEPF